MFRLLSTLTAGDSGQTKEDNVWGQYIRAILGDIIVFNENSISKIISEGSPYLSMLDGIREFVYGLENQCLKMNAYDESRIQACYLPCSQKIPTNKQSSFIDIFLCVYLKILVRKYVIDQSEFISKIYVIDTVLKTIHPSSLGSIDHAKEER